MSRARSFCFTWNNPPDDLTVQSAITQLNPLYAIWQLELGESGTPHIQGCLYFKNQRQFSAIKSTLTTCHIEKTIALQKAFDYCSKEDTRVRGPWEIGKRPAQGSRSDLYAIGRRIIDDGVSVKEIAETDPDVFIKYNKGLTALSSVFQTKRTWLTEVYVYWGSTGTGKTRTAFEKAPDAYWKEKGDWWDGYIGQPDIIIDEFAHDTPITTLLRWLDRYPIQVPVKGGFVNFVPKRIFITSNIPFDDWYPNALEEHRLALRRRITEIVHFNRPL